MTITPLVPAVPQNRDAEADTPLGVKAAKPDDFAAALMRALDEAGTALGRADDAERRFISGRGGLQEMVIERAQADVILGIAGAAAARTVQALTTILGMQV